MYFEAFLCRSSRDGNRCGRHLFHDIEQRATRAASRIWSGFSQAGAAPRGRARTVRRLLQSYASTSQRRCPIWNPATGRVISPVVAPALCTKPRDVLTINQATKVDVLKQGSHEFATMRRHAMRFRGILRGL